MHIKSMIREITQEERIALYSGGSLCKLRVFLQNGITALFKCDGSHGLRM